MATWKKVLVSGSSAALTSVTADTTVTVGSNVVGTSQSNTSLSGSFTGSFVGDGSGLTGVVAAFPTNAETNLNATDKFYVNTVLGGNEYITLSSLLNDIAGTNLAADPNTAGDGTTLRVIADPTFGDVTATTVTAAGDVASNNVGFIGTGSWAQSASIAITASYALNAGGGTLTISGSDNTSGTVSLASNPLIFSGSANEINTTVNGNIVQIGLPDNVTIAGDLAINGGDITTSQTTATIFNTTATGITIGGNTTTTTMQNLTLNGNLSVLGTTTSVTTQNLTVADRFILLGSSSLASNIDGGIVVQSTFAVNNGKATGSGYALFMDGANLTAGGSPRWSVTSSLSELAEEANPDEYMVTAKKASGAPASAPTYGSASLGYGNIYVNSSDESIWIYV
jgi:hypothetical protein